MTLICDYSMCHFHFSSSRAASTKRGISLQGPFFSLPLILFFYVQFNFSWYHAFKLLVDWCFCIFLTDHSYFTLLFYKVETILYCIVLLYILHVVLKFLLWSKMTWITCN
jgi:hypothetical protein